MGIINECTSSSKDPAQLRDQRHCKHEEETTGRILEVHEELHFPKPED